MKTELDCQFLFFSAIASGSFPFKMSALTTWSIILSSMIFLSIVLSPILTSNLEVFLSTTKIILFSYSNERTVLSARRVFGTEPLVNLTGLSCQTIEDRGRVLRNIFAPSKSSKLTPLVLACGGIGGKKQGKTQDTADRYSGGNKWRVIRRVRKISRRGCLYAAHV